MKYLQMGGVLVVHDCSPMTESIASPTFAHGKWCGVSYRSYLDFVLTRDDLGYCTVDIDFGCGIIFKNRTIDMVRPAVEPKLVAQWFDVHNDDQLRFRFFFRTPCNVAWTRLRKKLCSEIQLVYCTSAYWIQQPKLEHPPPKSNTR
jgi:hypothetical protein